MADTLNLEAEQHFAEFLRTEAPTDYDASNKDARHIWMAAWQAARRSSSSVSEVEMPTLIQALETGDDRESPRWFDIHASEVAMYTEEGYKVRMLYDRAATKAAAPADAPIEDKIGNTDHVGRGLEDMQQPYAGAIVLLETIAECGARPYIGNDPTPMRETCIEFANALRKAGRRAPAEDAREEVQDGWQLVPIEPTMAMVAALAFAGDEMLAIGHALISQGVIEDYKSMLAVAPKPDARRASSVPAIQGTGREKTCTCPSGDGSLRWPCQVHPSEAKAGEDA